MTQILNGTLPYIVEQCELIILIDVNGKEISTGIQILNGTLPQIVEQCDLIIPVTLNASGASIS